MVQRTAAMLLCQPGALVILSRSETRAAACATFAGALMLRKRVSVQLKANSCGVQHGSKQLAPRCKFRWSALLRATLQRPLVAVTGWFWVRGTNMKARAPHGRRGDAPAAARIPPTPSPQP